MVSENIELVHSSQSPQLRYVLATWMYVGHIAPAGHVPSCTQCVPLERRWHDRDKDALCLKRSACAV